jgi:hypothetical protein
MGNIINIERISEDRKQIFFTSSIEGEISIKVRDDFNEIPYFFKVYPGESFWINWLYSWYDKEVIFKIKNFEENFFIKGAKIDFSDVEINKNTYVQVFYFIDEEIKTVFVLSLFNTHLNPKKYPK